MVDYKRGKKMRFWSRLSVPIGILIIILLIGTISYHHIEKWRYLDSLYFSVATITTVGYGDFYPKTDTGKILTIIYPFLGIGTVLYIFSLTGRYVFIKNLRERMKIAGRLKGKRGIKRIRG